jgi:hypothetical protein
MSLSGWDNTKKLKLTIDNTKIDSTLTDFPILVSLSSSCGIGGYDARCVFDELYAHPYEVCDDFTWVNSSIPNPNLWRTGNSPYIDIYNNKLRFADNNSYSRADSEFSLSGDFNIQVDFEIINGPSTNSWIADVMVYLNNNGDFFAVRRSYTGGNHCYFISEYIGGSGAVVGALYNSTDTSGKLCIVRVGNIFSGYFWHNSGYWYKLSSKTYDMADNDIRYIRLRHSCWDGNPAFSFYFDNFKVNNGIAYFPNRLAAAVTVSGVETECYTEIEYWNQEDKEAILWTKVPTIVSGSDTELSLYYDKSHLNNWNYINFVGTAVGKAVWDDNFVGVWHMNQDPTGSASCIKDSTSNANHGTPGGSMTSGDLVDGKVGKALDFDGNDSITVAADSTLKFGTGDFTIESVFKTASATAQVLVGYGDRADNPGWTAQFTNQGYAQFLIDDGTTQSYMGDTINHADGAFHLQSAVLNRSGNGILYIDSVIADTADISGSNLTLDTIDHDDIEIGRVWYNLSFTNYMVGIIDEVRISNIARSASWIKATYYSNWDNLITYDRAKNYFSGTVKVENVLSARKVNLYDQITGELLGFTTSTSGIWAVDVYGDINTKYFAVCVPEFEGRNAEIFAHLTGA